MTSGNDLHAAGGADAEWRRILIAIPNWVGDVVMATPILAAVRARYCNARIAFLMRPYVREILAGGGWHDEEIPWSSARGPRRWLDDLRLGKVLRASNFDAALLMTNSLRSAAVACLARIPRRIGYGRDGRTLLLTDRLRPLRADGDYVPTPLLGYYQALAGRIGVAVSDLRLRLPSTPAQDAAAAALLAHYRVEPGHYVVLNPGAAFGAAKCWPAERFAEVAERLQSEHHLRSLVVGGPGELALMREIARRSRGAATACDDPATSLGSLKGVIRAARALVCNDTGPRHYGNALGIPTLTIFGPTHQAWTHTDTPTEIRIQAKVECGPCQLRVCPLDHRCMKEVTVEWVMQQLRGMLSQAFALPARPDTQRAANAVVEAAPDQGVLPLEFGTRMDPKR